MHRPFLSSTIVALSALALGWAFTSGACNSASASRAGTSNPPLGPQCTGAVAAASCEGLDDFRCQVTAGCTYSGECLGTAKECAAQSDELSCAQEDGCAWETINLCSGQPKPCFNFFDQFSCQQQTGCTWDAFNWFCSGTAGPCEDNTDQSGCASHVGCVWSSSKECQGTATECAQFTGRLDCPKQAGCFWSSQCAGTPTACADIPVARCADQRGCVCDGCEDTSSSSSSSGGGPTSCVQKSDCDPAKNRCFTGDCINGVCAEPPNCKPCTRQLDCDPHENGCFTGNCIDATCEAVPLCAPCRTQADCVAANDPCFTGNCVDAICEAITTCGGGDNCCVPGCGGLDSDCE